MDMDSFSLGSPGGYEHIQKHKDELLSSVQVCSVAMDISSLIWHQARFLHFYFFAWACKKMQHTWGDASCFLSVHVWWPHYTQHHEKTLTVMCVCVWLWGTQRQFVHWSELCRLCSQGSADIKRAFDVARRIAVPNMGWVCKTLV